MKLHGKSITGFIALALVIAFQNCSPSGTPDSKSQTEQTLASLRQSGGGGGYDGKIYLNYDLDKECSNGSLVRTAFQLRDGKMFQVRDACVDTQPTEVNAAEFALEAHNPGFGTFANKLFQLDEGTQTYAKVFCRGQQEASRQKATNKVDVWIDQESQGKLFGKIVIGRYNDNGELTDSFTGQGAEVSQSSKNGKSYFAAPEVEGRRLQLVVDPITMKGRFISVGSMNALHRTFSQPVRPGVQPSTPDFGNDPEVIGEMEAVRVTEMDCFMHGGSISD